MYDHFAQYFIKWTYTKIKYKKRTPTLISKKNKDKNKRQN